MADRSDTWNRRAACRGTSTALFFPKPGRHDAVLVAEAKAVCAIYPVREQCLAAGLADDYGIWGGLTGAERRALRRQRRADAA